MKRLAAAAIAALAILGTPALALADGSVDAAASYEEAQKHYNLQDISPYLPQKAGHMYDGVWSDGKDWLVSNGTLLLTVEGKTGKLANLSRQLDNQRIYGIYNAAGEDGTWLVVATADGNNITHTWDPVNPSAIRYLEIKDGVIKPVTINLPFPADGFGHAPLAFRANGRLYLITRPSPDVPSRLFEYANGSVTEVTIPDWAQERLKPYSTLLFRDGDALGAFNFPTPTDFQELIFDGEWRLTNAPGVVDGITEMRYAASREILERGGLTADIGGNIAIAYGLGAPRDALLFASKRDDGAALLSGFGANGARLLIARPVIIFPGYDNWVGTINLTVKRVPGSSSRYVLTAKGTQPLQTIRILKDGIGILRCDGSLCETTVDVKGTADRFEAWGVSIYPIAYPITSKSVLLRDTDRIADTPSWNTDDGSEIAWSWLRPSDFTRPETDRATWNIGTYLQETIPYSTVRTRGDYQFVPSKTGVAQAIAHAASLTVETFLEGRLSTTCKPPVQRLAELQQNIVRYGYGMSTIRIDACPASVAKTEAVMQNVTRSYGPYVYTTQDYASEVRVYGKVTWTDSKGVHVLISPTDVVRFEP